MRLLIYADLQTTDGDERCFSDPSVSLQHYRVARVFTDLLSVYRQYKCDGLVDLGDTTDDRSSISLPTLNLLGAMLSTLPSSKNNFKLTGNHEQYLRDCTIDNKHLFDHKFRVISQREIIRVEDCTFVFCAYPASHADLTEWLLKEASAIRGRKVLFGHFQIVGAYLNNAKTVTGVPLEALNGFDTVLLGHIHQPQSLTPRIHYVGSPFQQDWGEAGQLKHLSILDTDTLKVTTVPLEGYPQYRAVSLDEFKQAAQEGGEDRLRVVLKNHEEAEAFFCHPAFNRATAHYDYAETAKGEAQEEIKDWTFDGICRRYIELVPPSKIGIDFSDEDMLAIGQTIATEG